MSVYNTDENLPRWVKASILSYFDTALAGRFPLFAEGQVRETDKHQAWIELRLTGPWYVDHSGYTRVELEVDALCHCRVNNDLNLMDRLTGVVNNILNKKIPVLKLGDGVVDTQALIECLNIDSRRKNMIINFGQVAPTILLLRSSVEAKYWMVI